tara:strand:- start:283 stop:1167 length:885 start_codon:yes stop_codon:yes gene_type:complete
MCNEQDLARWARDTRMTRRGFGGIAGAGASVAVLPGALAGCVTGAYDNRLTEGAVSFSTPDGTMDGFFVRPTRTSSPGVLFWPDIAGLRETKRNMARRLAGEGYAVLVVNPYYRDVAGEQFADFADFAGTGGFQTVKPWREKLTAEAIMSDATAAVGWLDAQAEVDTARGIGTQGYCMGGPFTFWSAAAVPSRIKGVASFHGGGLVREGDPMSPHNTFADTQARYLVAIAKNDDAEAPEDKTILREAAAQAGRPAKIEVFSGDHGWTVPDSPAYDRPEAERAYADLLALYGKAL